MYSILEETAVVCVRSRFFSASATFQLYPYLPQHHTVLSVLITTVLPEALCQYIDVEHIFLGTIDHVICCYHTNP